MIEILYQKLSAVVVLDQFQTAIPVRAGIQCWPLAQSLDARPYAVAMDRGMTE
ncbi:MAG: hypothetical protein WDM81_06805 [Rhizomicrobium sp.]